jgi:hypothetical protein
MVITLLGFIGLRCWLGGDEAQMMVGGFSFKKVNNMEEEKLVSSGHVMGGAERGIVDIGSF